MTVVERRYGVAGGLAVKAPVRVATTANITLSGLQTIDGVTLVADDRVLVKDQTDTTANGIYVASSGNWTRDKDFNGNLDATDGTRVFVRAGNSYARTEWVVNASGDVTFGTTAFTFNRLYLSGQNDNEIASKVALEGANVSGDVLSLFARGYASEGDGGHAFYKRVSSQPTAGGVRSLDRYLPNGTTDATNGGWWQIADVVINAKMLGVKLDGSTDDTSAWNTIIAGINSGGFTEILIPEGETIVSAKLTTITASNWVLRGIGADSTKFSMDVSAGVNGGTFLQIGDSDDTCSDWSIHGITFDCTDVRTSLDGSTECLDLSNVTRGRVMYCRFVNCGGGLKLGDLTDETDCRQTNIDDVHILLYGPAGGTGIKFDGSSNTKVQNFSISCPGGGTNLNTRGMWIRPASTGGDSIKCVNGEINLTQTNSGYALEIDGTDNFQGNVTFTNCVFDRAENASVYLHVDSPLGAEPLAGIHVQFSNCIFDAGNTSASQAVSILVDNTGNGYIFAAFNNCDITSNNGYMVKVTGGNAVNLHVSDCQFLNRGSTAASSCIYLAASSSGVNISDCFVTDRITVAGDAIAQPAYFIEFAGDASNIKVIGNDYRACQTALMTGSGNIAAGNVRTVIFRDNIGLGHRWLRLVDTTDATPTVVWSKAWSEQDIGVVSARILGERAAATDSCYFDIVGLFKREAAGSLTQIDTTRTRIGVEPGAPAVDGDLESAAGMNVAFNVNSNTLEIKVTGTASTVRWYGVIEDEVPQ